MDQTNSITNQEKRKRCKPLTLDEHGMIQTLYRNGYTLRAIADCVSCAHTIVFYELRRDTPTKKGVRGHKSPMRNIRLYSLDQIVGYN